VPYYPTTRYLRAWRALPWRDAHDSYAACCWRGRTTGAAFFLLTSLFAIWRSVRAGGALYISRRATEAALAGFVCCLRTSALATHRSCCATRRHCCRATGTCLPLLYLSGAQLRWLAALRQQPFGASGRGKRLLWCVRAATGRFLPSYGCGYSPSVAHRRFHPVCGILFCSARRAAVLSAGMSVCVDGPWMPLPAAR